MLLAVTWFVSSQLTRLSIGLAHRNHLLATPNERSSHRVPTPRVGGIGIYAGMLVAFAVAALQLGMPERLPQMLQPGKGALDWLKLAGVALSVTLAFVLGFWDDRHNTPAFVKLLCQVAIAVIPPVAGLQLTQLSIPFLATVTLHPIIGIALTSAWILVMMNVVNFMDGINGLAGRFGQVAAVATLVAVANLLGSAIIVPLAACLYGSVWGFLVYNTPKAETFMGDCGSQPLGVFVALLGVMVCEAPFTFQLPFLGFLIVVSPFLFDVVFTLLQRLSRGENVFQAHRGHLYQRHLIATGEDHQRTLSFVELHLYATAVIGAVYMRFYFLDSHRVAQCVLLVLAAAVLAHYFIKVRMVEKRAALSIGQAPASP